MIRTNNIDRIEEMLKRLEQALFDVGFIKTMAARAICIAKDAPEGVALAEHLERRYRVAKRHRRAAEATLEQLLARGMASQSAGRVRLFNAALDEVARLSRHAAAAEQP